MRGMSAVTHADTCTTNVARITYDQDTKIQEIPTASFGGRRYTQFCYCYDNAYYVGNSLDSVSIVL